MCRLIDPKGAMTDHTVHPMPTYPPCRSSPNLPRIAVPPRFRRGYGSPRACRFGRQLPSCRRCAPWPFMIVIQCRQGGNIMASGPPSCSCSRYNSAALVFAPLVSFPSVGNKSTCHVVLWSSGPVLSQKVMTSERSKCAEHLVVLPLSGCARVSRCSTTLSRW